MALGNDLAFIWSDNSDSCDLPRFVAVSWKPGAPHLVQVLRISARPPADRQD